MPRRQFVADLEKAQSSLLPPCISDVKAGEDDGQIEFHYAPGPGSPAVGNVKIIAMIPELSDYPKSHDYIIFSDDDAPRDLASVLTNVRGTSRKTVFELLEIVSASLQRVHNKGNEDSQMADPMEAADLEQSEDDVDIYGSDHEAFGDSTHLQTLGPASAVPIATSSSSDIAFRNRIRSDLRSVKLAGFKVGCLGHLLHGHNAFVSVSIRMSKLGVSEEAMQAWQMAPSDYLMLLIQYPNGYKTNTELQNYNGLRVSANVGMRVVAGTRYKPTLQEAIKAFTVVATERRDAQVLSDIPGPAGSSPDECSIRDTFISKSLAGLMNERLTRILSYRSAGMSWQGAEDWYDAQANMSVGSSVEHIPPALCYETEKVSESFPSIVRADHHAHKNVYDFSFPLLAMQFLLRHFVRCTEFCLVCHRRLDTDVEAIKPYVCERGLCLYQYMALGFGPSIEHEILAQPYVVDLLISFAFTSAAARKLVEFPDALSLTVPYIERPKSIRPTYAYGHSTGTSTDEPQVPPQKVVTYDVGFDRTKLEIIFWDASKPCPLKKGNWIVLDSRAAGGFGKEIHCRIIDTSLYPTISVNEPIVVAQDPNSEGGNDTPNSGMRTPDTTEPATPSQKSANWINTSFRMYDQDFERLQKIDKHVAICKLLDTLPSVIEMREYLILRRSTELKRWVERISPSALSLLRWIIASNRACIMQVDSTEALSNNPSTSTLDQSSVQAAHRGQERVYGMHGHVQFRFAMGAPDKEQRFLNEVRKTSTRLKLTYPTLFAWHGSPLYNWHTIIREGLHYRNKDHGRAYGDGIYHARDSGTSSGYSGFGVGSTGWQWRNSVLRASSALALNEIVNAPSEFQSNTPYYVVQHVDWVQTRFLFVKCAQGESTIQVDDDSEPKDQYPQDPNAIPSGTNGKIVIPASAIHSKRAEVQKISHKIFEKNPNPLKKLKAAGGVSTPISIEDDFDDFDDFDDIESIDTDIEDREFLCDESPESQTTAKVSGPVLDKEVDMTWRLAGTDFKPGTLDFSTLPIMPVPAYATSGTTKWLMRELQTLQKIQGRTPLVELGWYIDIEKIENVYQWIVELHSFHTFEVRGRRIPLADDMKKKGIKGVVLEVRFNKDFPYTPPYIRVIRPRFLTLAQGGGGHIVMGGAMCMELLTNTGWSSASTMESVLMQIRLAIASEPFARLDKHSNGDYNASEGAHGYIRAATVHGWSIPPGFSEMAFGTQEQNSRV